MSWLRRVSKTLSNWTPLSCLTPLASVRAAGAIPFVKTNLGHTLMMGESVNHLFGRSLNPWNRSLTPGGSSGGEAALLAFRGSPVGWGTDIGGSIRLPSAWVYNSLLCLIYYYTVQLKDDLARLIYMVCGLLLDEYHIAAWRTHSSAKRQCDAFWDQWVSHHMTLNCSCLSTWPQSHGIRIRM